MPEGGGREFFIQWHVTAKCDQKCSHCYMYNEEAYKKELAEELSFQDCIKILDNLHSVVGGVIKRTLQINFSGGDPLLRKDFLDLLEEARNRKIKIGILGNPHHITDELARYFYRLGLRGYQVSLDGMKEVHDKIRGKGSFDITMQGIRTLKKAGVPVQVMFTISKGNKEDLIKAANLCHNENVDTFAFDSMIPVGNADRELVLSSQELRESMFNYQQFSWKIAEKGTNTQFRFKNNLWTLLESELGLETKLVNASRKSPKICAGCTIGINALSILSNGVIYPCRRLPLPIGKFPEQKFEEVFFGKEMNNLRKEEDIEKCGDCEFFKVCRGCRALAYAVNGNYFSADPQNPFFCTIKHAGIHTPRQSI